MLLTLTRLMHTAKSFALKTNTKTANNARPKLPYKATPWIVTIYDGTDLGRFEAPFIRATTYINLGGASTWIIGWLSLETGASVHALRIPATFNDTDFAQKHIVALRAYRRVNGDLWRIRYIYQPIQPLPLLAFCATDVTQVLYSRNTRLACIVHPPPIQGPALSARARINRHTWM